MRDPSFLVALVPSCEGDEEFVDTGRERLLYLYLGLDHGRAGFTVAVIVVDVHVRHDLFDLTSTNSRREQLSRLLDYDRVCQPQWTWTEITLPLLSKFVRAFTSSSLRYAPVPSLPQAKQQCRTTSRNMRISSSVSTSNSPSLTRSSKIRNYIKKRTADLKEDLAILEALTPPKETPVMERMMALDKLVVKQAKEIESLQRQLAEKTGHHGFSTVAGKKE
ncbi:hypothetical protein BDZ85DRAFT_295275 [Elsinoe ampelina]|uniref:Uncharacterized protein n=1 Tax=Elsinoe ampelina TaxID=302913 RepID=A0A6A6GEQ4_9PEZI|nr:hypothetical protein BDZ85DRAFT_295275 [Elsinoe ampelina]